MFRFEDPYFLLLFFLIPLMIYLYIAKPNKMRIKYSSLKEVKRLYPVNSNLGQHFLFLLRIITVMLLITALARPVFHQKVTEKLSSGVDIMLVMDTSGSMNTQDYPLNGFMTDRLTAVKSVVKEFITKRPADRMGMVVFGTEAFTQCPITLDHAILSTLMKDIRIGMVGESTAIGTAIGIAVKRLKDIKAKSKIIILLTDGRSNVGQIAPITAAEIAKTYGIKIYTIGVGSKHPTGMSLGQMLQGYNPNQVSLDEETLEKIANITGGLYFKATNTEALKEIYNTIDKMEKTDRKVKEYGKNNEIFGPFLILAILTFILELILANTLLAKIP